MSLTVDRDIQAVQREKLTWEKLSARGTFLEHLKADSEFIGKLIVAGYLKHGAMADTRHRMGRLKMSDVEKQHRKQGDVTDEELTDLMSFVNNLPSGTKGKLTPSQISKLSDNDNLTNAEKMDQILKGMSDGIVVDYLRYYKDHSAAAQLVETVKREQIGKEWVAVVSDQSPMPVAKPVINERYGTIQVHGNRQLIVETAADDISSVFQKMRAERKKFYALEPLPDLADGKEEEDIRKDGMDHIFIYDGAIIYVDFGEELDYKGEPLPLHKRNQVFVQQKIMEARRNYTPRSRRSKLDDNPAQLDDGGTPI